MNDKSPRQHLSKKSAKSLKEKRTEKRDEQTGQPGLLPLARKAQRPR